jgi:hypothetical protein
MGALDRLIPAPRLMEIDDVDLAAEPTKVWDAVRSGDLAQSALTRALFTLRTLPDRIAGKPSSNVLRLGDMVSTPEHPGFQILVDDAPEEVAVGAIGQVWKPEIPFVHVADAAAFAAFSEPGYVKVAWSLHVSRLSLDVTRLELELRVDATDEAAWRKFRRYFLLIGLPSRFIRRSLLSQLARAIDRPERHENDVPMAGDEVLPDAADQLTDGITIRATPEEIWPWLVQMGSRRAGFYSIDLLDNAGRRSAREIHPEFQAMSVGDRIPATPEGEDGFEVLRVDEPRALVLGGLYDSERNRQVKFADPRPVKYWHATWAFALEPLDPRRTRLRTRVRVAYPAGQGIRAAWMGPAHRLMERAQLRNLAARVEGRTARDDWREVLDGVQGAAAIAVAMLTPRSRERRSHWGLTAEEAARPFPGDDLVEFPTWSWTHAVEIDAPASEVWPWVAQIGGDRAGFYSYQWLENLAGAEHRNAERPHPEWEVRKGDDLLVHSHLPALTVTRVDPGHWFLALATTGVVSVSWLFLVEPRGEGKCRFVSRYRCDSTEDFRSKVEFGPWIAEPVGFAMDRRMLLGVKERAERAHMVAR